MSKPPKLDRVMHLMLFHGKFQHAFLIAFACINFWYVKNYWQIELRLKAKKGWRWRDRFLEGPLWFYDKIHRYCHVKYTFICLYEFAKNSLLVFMKFRSFRCNTCHTEHDFTCIYKICNYIKVTIQLPYVLIFGLI